MTTSNTTYSAPPVHPLGSRLLAVLEIILTFVVIHVSFKALKQLTSFGAYERAAGLNFTPGVLMAVGAFLCIALRRGMWGSYGLALPNTSRAKLWFIVLPVVYGIPFTVFLRWHVGGPRVGALVFFCLVAVTSVGEELFFRGYIQSRLNGLFGHPWCIGGIPVGFGLFLSATLFGILHGLNTVDYFHGRYGFAWGWALVTLAGGVLYGAIREKTGSVVPGMIVHGLLDVWILSFAMLLRT